MESTRKKIDKRERKRPVLWVIRGIFLICTLIPLAFFIKKSYSEEINKLVHETQSLNSDYASASKEATRPNENDNLNITNSKDRLLELSDQATSNDLASEENINFSKSLEKFKFVSNATPNNEIENSKNVKEFSEGSAKSSLLFSENNENDLNASLIYIDNTLLSNLTENINMDLNAKSNSKHDFPITDISQTRKTIVLNKLTSSTIKQFVLNKQVVEMNQSGSFFQEKKKYLAKSSLGIQFSVGKSFRTISSNDPLLRNYVKLRSNKEKQLETKTFSFLYKYRINKKLGIYSGLSWRNTTENLEYKNYFDNVTNLENQDIGTYTNHLGNELKLTGNQQVYKVYDVNISRYNNLNMLSIPIGFDYFLNFGLIEFAISNGIEIPIMVNYNGRIIGKDLLPVNISDTPELNISYIPQANHSISMIYSLAPNTRFEFGLGYLYDLSSRTRVLSIEQKYQSINVQMGVSYKIK